jgi:hypothetical protein
MIWTPGNGAIIYEHLEVTLKRYAKETVPVVPDVPAVAGRGRLSAAPKWSSPNWRTDGHNNRRREPASGREAEDFDAVCVHESYFVHERDASGGRFHGIIDEPVRVPVKQHDANGGAIDAQQSRDTAGERAD